ncbi:hypothetical protein JMJ35_007129 [Cladonia borealis]|uniref:O-methyltransferase n=1 Tax=Cladonia borealis TaxID=184061 RepID=A0AA39QWS8_9LECA|nr:hypothetical protein JMJ35_007129 [Cladonia borealis]
MAFFIVADDLQLFKQLDQRASEPKTTSELARSCGAEPALLGRILRHLASNGVIDECAGEGKSYQSTELSRTLATPEGSSGIRQVADVYTPVLGHMPEYLKAIGYKVPKDVESGPFQRTVGRPGQAYFKWIQEPQNKRTATDFNLLMKFTTRFRKSWMDVFPPDELIQGQTGWDVPLLVDIGGGIGTDVMEFRRRYPDVPGKVVLQELPAVLKSAKESETRLVDLSIESQAYDFFLPQPVHGARIYFLSSVLHDWPDQDARKILRNVTSAMTRGYTVLLLSENVIPATGCNPHLSALDLTMMTLFGSQERTEEHWRGLLESEGLKLVMVYTIPSCLKSVLKLEKA